ncbi:5'-AMP-activated protein kinase, regulatory gamma subunit, partial [Paragonimus westermani]
NAFTTLLSLAIALPGFQDTLVTEQLTEYQRPLVYITPEKTLLEAVCQLLKHKVHRLPVIDPVSGNPLHILTHKRVLKYLHINLSQLPKPSFMSKRLCDLKLGTTEGIVTVSQDCALHRALQYFIDFRVSALPVVDAQGRLVDIYAKFDVINLAATRTYRNLDITVYEALNYRRGVHRLVIVQDEKVVGIVSLSDLLRFLIADPDIENTLT